MFYFPTYFYPISIKKNLVLQFKAQCAISPPTDLSDCHPGRDHPEINYRAQWSLEMDPDQGHHEYKVSVECGRRSKL